MLLISLPADSTTPCLIQIYDFLYNPDSLLSYSIAVEARGSTSSNAPTIEDDLSLYWRIQLGCGSPDNKMSVLPPSAGFRHVVIAPADPPHPAHGPRQHGQTATGPRTPPAPAGAELSILFFRLPLHLPEEQASLWGLQPGVYLESAFCCWLLNKHLPQIDRSHRKLDLSDPDVLPGKVSFPGRYRLL